MNKRDQMEIVVIPRYYREIQIALLAAGFMGYFLIPLIFYSDSVILGSLLFFLTRQMPYNLLFILIGAASFQTRTVHIFDRHDMAVTTFRGLKIPFGHLYRDPLLKRRRSLKDYDSVLFRQRDVLSADRYWTDAPYTYFIGFESGFRSYWLASFTEKNSDSGLEIAQKIADFLRLPIHEDVKQY